MDETLCPVCQTNQCCLYPYWGDDRRILKYFGVKTNSLNDDVYTYWYSALLHYFAEKDCFSARFIDLQNTFTRKQFLPLALEASINKGVEENKIVIGDYRHVDNENPSKSLTSFFSVFWRLILPPQMKPVEKDDMIYIPALLNAFRSVMKHHFGNLNNTDPIYILTTTEQKYLFYLEERHTDIMLKDHIQKEWLVTEYGYHIDNLVTIVKYMLQHMKEKRLIDLCEYLELNGDLEIHRTESTKYVVLKFNEEIDTKKEEAIFSIHLSIKEIEKNISSIDNQIQKAKSDARIAVSVKNTTIAKSLLLKVKKLETKKEEKNKTLLYLQTNLALISDANNQSQTADVMSHVNTFLKSLDIDNKGEVMMNSMIEIGEYAKNIEAMNNVITEEQVPSNDNDINEELNQIINEVNTNKILSLPSPPSSLPISSSTPLSSSLPSLPSSSTPSLESYSTGPVPLFNYTPINTLPTNDSNIPSSSMIPNGFPLPSLPSKILEPQN
ncbi:hypothetical protein WA158_001200 [Blastocystis sp. Blastoise]